MKTITQFLGPRKIKRFKIYLRPFGVYRKLKRAANFSANEFRWMDLIREEIEKVSSLISPAIIYGNWGINEAREILVCSNKDLNKRVLTVSFLAATIGERFSADLIDWQEGAKRRIWPALGEEALEQTINFANRLILTEAKQDNCQILSQILPRDIRELENIIESLSAEKIGVRIENGKVVPSFSLLSYFPWILQGKASRPARKS